MTEKESIDLIDAFIHTHAGRITSVPLEDMPDDCHLQESEINTFSFRNLFNISIQILESFSVAEKFLLENISLQQEYIVSRNNDDRVEPLHLTHLLQDNYWISNRLSSSILENGEKHLKGTVLGEDPLFEAGKRLLASNFLAAKVMRIITVKQLMYISSMRSRSFNHVKIITPVMDKKRRRVTLTVRYREGCTRAANGRATNKSVCNWYRGALSYHLDSMQMHHHEIKETSCVSEGDECCIFECSYIPRPFLQNIRTLLISLIDPSLAHRMEHLAQSERELLATASDLRKKDRETKKQLNDLLMELTNKNTQLETLTVTDPLTGLYNRKYYAEHLKESLRISMREEKPLAVAMIDIDHFKAVNDTYGHAAGDDCLRMLGEVLKKELKHNRAGDFAARYGGEEFIVIFSGAEYTWTNEKAEHIRRIIENRTVETVNSHDEGVILNITVSIGLAFGHPDREETVLSDPEIITRHADELLYKAKEQGRNRLVSALTL